MCAKKILVVDDSDLSRRLIGRLLAAEGWSVLTAADGAEGAVTALSEQPDLVVTDLEMPVMDGFQLSRLLKSDRVSEGIPVLMMTSHSDASSRFWGLETGADAYLLKSAVQEELVDAVRSLLEVQPRDPQRRPADPPRTPLDVLARVGRHLDARLLEAVLINRVLEKGMESEDLAEASRAVLSTVAELADCWLLGLLVDEIGRSSLYLRTDLAGDDPRLLAFIEQLPSRHDGVRRKLAEREVVRSGMGRPEAGAALGPTESLEFSLRGGRAHLFLVPKASLRDDGRERRLLEALRGHLALVLDNARLAQRLRELSTRDGLTRLLNRRTVHQRLVQELERAARYEQPLSLMLCDLDRFKNINDTHGHLAGDRVLEVVADLFRLHARSADIVGRFGGEEFVLILPSVALGQAVHAANRLLEALAAEEVTIDDGLSIPVSASFGVASLDELTTPTTDSLLALADLRLYEAKNSGRARVVPKSPDSSPSSG